MPSEYDLQPICAECWPGTPVPPPPTTYRLTLCVITLYVITLYVITLYVITGAQRDAEH